LDQIWRQMAFGEAGECQEVGPGGIQMLGDCGQFVDQGVEDAVELGMHGVGVGLVIDRVQ
jgi:hypothetical protein